MSTQKAHYMLCASCAYLYREDKGVKESPRALYHQNLMSNKAFVNSSRCRSAKRISPALYWSKIHQ